MGRLFIEYDDEGPPRVYAVNQFNREIELDNVIAMRWRWQEGAGPPQAIIEVADPGIEAAVDAEGPSYERQTGVS